MGDKNKFLVTRFAESLPISKGDTVMFYCSIQAKTHIFQLMATQETNTDRYTTWVIN